MGRSIPYTSRAMRSRLLCAAALASLFSSACIDDELVNPLGAGGQGAGGDSFGGSSATGATGGSGGSGPPPSRGNPDDFPTDCLETCEEACEALLQCEGAESEAFPLGSEECLLRCGAAIDGPFWDDLSGNFRCCASQTECGAVQHCGGWLKHPDVVEGCDQICGCFTSNSLAELNAGHDAPPGYRFAPDLVMVEPLSSGVPLTGIPGVRLYRDAPVKTLKIGAQEQPATLTALRQVARILPTFVDGKGRTAAATGRVVVKVDSPAARQRADLVAKTYGLTRVRKMKLGEVYIYETPDAFRSLDSIAPLNAKTGVRAELDLLRHYQKNFTPNDPLFADQWHLHNTGQRNSLIGVDARITEAWDVTTGDPEVIIAINDDGVDLNHPDFAGKLEPELNFPADWEAQIGEGSFCTFGWHGTQVAGVAAAQGDNAYMGSGVCSECRILPHLLGPSVDNCGGFQVTTVGIAEGFVNQVDAGAWIISNSWGPATGDPLYVDNPVGLPPLSSVVKDAFDYAESTGRGGLGTVILFASGNSNDIIDHEAGYVNNLAVGAVDNLGLKSYYSSHGPELDLAAPSNGGLAGITTTASLAKFDDNFGGTSSACPYAAGVVGLVMSANKTLTAAEVRDIVTSTAKQIDPIFGGWTGDTSEAYGHGLVNAYAAVQMATGACSDPTDCLAPSDECAPGTCNRGLCELCRVDEDCGNNHVCQSMPSLGINTCVPEKGQQPCPPDTNEQNGYCLPTLQACGLCGQSESCNGRDDECDGEVDDDDVCQGSPRCFPEGVGCAADRACTASFCLSECTTDDDCEEGQSCREGKTQYGAASGMNVCITAGGNASQCALGCEVVASTVDDATLAEFAECAETANCATAFGCFQLLPVQF